MPQIPEGKTVLSPPSCTESEARGTSGLREDHAQPDVQMDPDQLLLTLLKSTSPGDSVPVSQAGVRTVFTVREASIIKGTSVPPCLLSIQMQQAERLQAVLERRARTHPRHTSQTTTLLARSEPHLQSEADL